MEHFGARDARPKDECLRIIAEESDSFVGIYAHRYGYLPRGSRKSITEMEFDAAESAKLPRFAYLVDEGAPWSPKYIDDGVSKRRLEQFKGRLRDSLIYKPFSTGDNLAASVAADLGRHLATLQLRHIQASDSQSAPGPMEFKSTEEWNRHRDDVYTQHRGLFLVHTLSPSRIPGQLFDIHIYLRKHKTQKIPEVAHAEFFLGRHWGSSVFKVDNEGGLIGLSTSAYGEFLCVCRVTFSDGEKLMLERYIDFGTYSPPSI
jgi:hypothetical protein